MVTSNIAIDLDITNGARGTVVDIFLNPEEPLLGDSTIVTLKYLPQCVLVKLHACYPPRRPQRWCHPDFSNKILYADHPGEEGGNPLLKVFVIT